MELEGTKGVFDMSKSSRTWSLFAVSFIWLFWTGCRAVLAGGGEKRPFQVNSDPDFGGPLPTWHPCSGAPSVSFWFKIRIWQGRHRGSRLARLE